MIKAFLLLITPVTTWERIAEAKRGIVLILLIHLLPLLLGAAAGEYYGLTHWGKQRAEYGKPTVMTSAAALRYEAGRVGLGLAVVFLGAQLIAAIGRSLHPRHSYAPSFTLVAYAASPLFLTQALYALPFMPWWVVWTIGITLTAAALYQGVPHIMKPDPPQTIGLYFMSVIALTCLTLISAFLASKFADFQTEAAAPAAAILPH